MRILYLHQFFTTREGSGGTRSYEFARHLVGAGHRVTMVTAGGESVVRRRYSVDGIDVVEVRGGYADYMRATARPNASRIAAFGGFAAAATAAALRAPRPDVVFATSPALTIAIPGVAAARRHRAPLVFEVRDLWPRAPIEMGALRDPVARALATRLEHAAYSASEHVVALSPGMRDGVVAAGVDPGDVTMIPNAADLDLFFPDLDPGDVRGALGIDPSTFVASYFGTMGEANDLGQVVRAAQLLCDRGEEGVIFVLQGDGKRRPALAAEVERLGLRNVVLAPASDKGSAARLAAASDACMTIFKDVPVLATNSPNKLFDTFAAGRAAIVNTAGWQRELVQDNDAGVFTRPGDPADLADQVMALRDDPERTRRMGANGRALAEREFDRRLLGERLRGVLETAAGIG